MDAMLAMDATMDVMEAIEQDINNAIGMVIDASAFQLTEIELFDYATREFEYWQLTNVTAFTYPEAPHMRCHRIKLQHPERPNVYKTCIVRKFLVTLEDNPHVMLRLRMV